MATPNPIAAFFTVSIQHSNMPHILRIQLGHCKIIKKEFGERIPFVFLSFVIPVNKLRVCEHVFPECSQSVPWFCFERVSKCFLKGTKGPTTCRQGLNGSHTLHLGYQLLSPCFTLQGQEISARSISTHTSNNGLYTITWMKYSLQSTSNSVKPSFDSFNIMAMIQ